MFVMLAVAVLAAVFGLLPASPASAQTPDVTLGVAPTTLSEGDSATDVTVTATLSTIQSGTTTVTLSLAGTANLGTDYSVVGTLPTITIPSGQTEGSSNVILAPTNDTFWEGEETIEVNGSATGGLAVSGATLKLSDNETRPSIILYLDPSTSFSARRIQEDSGTPTSFTLHAELEGGSTLEADTPVTLSVDESRSSADLGTHFIATLPAMEIKAGATVGTATFAVTPIDNDLRHQGLTRSIYIGGAADDHKGNPFEVRRTQTLIRIIDDEPPLQIQLRTTPTRIREADLVANATTSFDVTVSLSGEDTLPSAVTVRLTKGSDPCGIFSFSTDNIGRIIAETVIPAGSTSTSQTIQQTVSLTNTGNPIDELCVVALIARDAASRYRADPQQILVIPDENPSIVRVTIRGRIVTEPWHILNVGEHVEVFFEFNRPFSILDGSATTTLRIGDSDRTATCSIRASGLACLFNVESGQHDLDGFEHSDLRVLTITGSTVDYWDRTIPVTVDSTLPPESQIEIEHYTASMVHGAVTSYRLLSSIESLQESPDPTDIRLTATWLAGRTYSRDITFPISFTDVTTTEGDYTVSGTRAITIPGGTVSGSTTVAFTAVEDGIREARSETVLIGGGNDQYFVIGTELELIDSPTIELSVPSVSVIENGSDQTMTITAALGDPSDSPRARPIVVSLNLSGSAGPGDYTFAGPLQVTIPAGARSGSASLTLNPTDDRLLEGDETIVVSGFTPALTVVGTGTITIEDDETEPEVILTASPITVREDDSAPTQITVSAVLDPDIVLPDDATVVTLTLGGTATTGSGQDYTSAWDPQPPQITIPRGELAATTTVTLTVTPLQDELEEGEETIVVEGTASTGLVVDVRGSTIRLIDDDVPDIVLAPNTFEVTEGGTASYTVALALEPTGTVTVTMTTALGATDLSVATSSTVLYFTPENWDRPQTVNVAAMEDDDAVADATVTLVHEASGGAYEGVTSEASVTIKENDAPNVTVSATTLQVLEGMEEMYSVVLTSQPTGDVTVTMDTDLSETDLSATPSPTELTFTTSNWDQPQTVTVSAAADADAVDDPAVTLEHSVSGGDYAGVAVSSVTVTIVEQTVPLLSITGGAAQEGEGVDFVVILSATSSKSIVVGYATEDGTAMTPDDYAAATSSLTFLPGETSRTVTVVTVEDVLHEPDETFRVELSSPVNADIRSGAGTATGTITDDDAAPTAVSLSLDPSSVAESAAATAVTVTASLNNSPLPSATTVTVSRTGGTAESGTDYPAISNFTVTIPAGVTSGTTTLSFDPSQDTLAEGDETVILTGTAVGLTPGAATLTIIDDDAAPTAVSLSLEPDSVVESAAATAVTVTASLNNSPLPSATTVTVSRTGGTAASGTDYPAISNFTVTIPAGGPAAPRRCRSTPRRTPWRRATRR